MPDGLAWATAPLRDPEPKHRPTVREVYQPHGCATHFVLEVFEFRSLGHRWAWQVRRVLGGQDVPIAYSECQGADAGLAEARRAVDAWMSIVREPCAA